MSFLGKLAFWKKSDDISDIGKDLGLDKDLGMDMGPQPDFSQGMGNSMQNQSMFQKYPSFQPTNNFSQPVFQQPQTYGSNGDITSKNLEIISSKLDALRASLESINQRLSSLEAIARGEQEDRRRRYY